jgi:hypothetical protein
MPDLTFYTGRVPNDFAMSFMLALEKEGFEVAQTKRSSYKGQSKTIRITWRGVYVGQMKDDLWTRKPPFVCLCMFPDPKRVSIAKAPKDFDKAAFAQQHSCDPEMLRVNTDSSGSYLWVRDHATGLLLMRDWARRIDEVFFGRIGSSSAEGVQDDLLTIIRDGSKSETERFAEVAARLGQGKFRADLEQEYASACAATGLTVSPALRASHIVPWRASNAKERLDPKNGLLLSANLDALFDRYLVTFRPNGELALSNSLTRVDQGNLGPLKKLMQAPCDKRGAYLARHNAVFDQFERERAAYADRSHT